MNLYCLPVRQAQFPRAVPRDHGLELGTLLQKRSAQPDTVLSFTCGQMLFGALFQLLMSFVTDEWSRFHPAQISRQSVFAVLYLVVLGSIIGLNCYLWLLIRILRA